MLKFMLREPGQKANSVSSLFWVFTVLGTEICALITSLISVAMNSFGVAAIGLFITASVWFTCYMTSMYYQSLANAAGGVKGAPAVENVDRKMKTGAKIMLVAAVVIAHLLLVDAVIMQAVAIFVAPEFPVWAFAPLSIVSSLLSMWMTALWMQCMGEVASEEPQTRFGPFRPFLKNAGKKMQVLASVELVAALVGAVTAIIGGILLTIFAENAIGLAIGFGGAVLLLAYGWAYAVYMQNLGNAARGDDRVALGFFRPLLGNTPAKMKALTVIVLVLTLAAAAGALVAGVVLAATMQTILFVIAGVAAAVVIFFLGWMNMLALHILGEKAQSSKQTL